LACVVRSEGRLTPVEIGPIGPIERAVERWRAAVAAVDAAAEQEAGGTLRALVLDPALNAAGEVDVLRVRLDDILHLVPLDALSLGDGAVGERYAVFLESPFDPILARSPPLPPEPSALVFGGIDFGPGPGAGVVPPVGFPPLPETEREARSIAECFQDAWGVPVSLRTESAATKEEFLALAPRSRFLHLATHAWFDPASFSADGVGPEGLSPFSLCGMAFAGANQGRGWVETSLLTGEELAALDLSACELAVLSADDTAVGERRAGQGVASLQQALLRAGARSSITSLWKVSDAAARELFVEFYRRLWIDRRSKSQALWEAKAELRRAGHPTCDWGGWILVGEPD
jgi:CHAT domain-containing protein